MGFHAWKKDDLVRDVISLFRAGALQPRWANLARFAHLTWVCKSAGHQLALPADMSARVSSLANDTYGSVISRDILPTHSSSNDGVVWIAASAKGYIFTV